MTVADSCRVVEMILTVHLLYTKSIAMAENPEMCFISL